MLIAVMSVIDVLPRKTLDKESSDVDVEQRLEIEVKCLNRLQEEFDKAREKLEIQKQRVTRLAEEVGKVIVGGY